MRDSNTVNYRIELSRMTFIDYTTCSVANPDPVGGGNQTRCSGIARVVQVRNLHLSESTTVLPGIT